MMRTCTTMRNAVPQNRAEAQRTRTRKKLKKKAKNLESQAPWEKTKLKVRSSKFPLINKNSQSNWLIKKKKKKKKRLSKIIAMTH